MMTKLEEVAQALCRRDCGKAWDQYLDDARAVIEALREPNAEMLSQREPIEYTTPEGEFRIIIDAATKYGVWHQMIDAILNEPSAALQKDKPCRKQEDLHMTAIAIKKEIQVEAKVLKIYCKVCDNFTANLVDQNGDTIHDQEDGYVPGFMPGEHYGDYLILDIDLDTGKVLNWKPPTAKDIQKWISPDED